MRDDSARASRALGTGPSGLGSGASPLGSAAPSEPLGSGPGGLGSSASRLDSHPQGSSPTSSAGAAGSEPSGRAAPAEPSDREAGAEPNEVAPSAPEGRAEPGAASLWEALREVNDPEFPISVVDLGLIYDIRRTGTRVEVDLTFTATACPCMDFIREDVRDRLLKEPGVEEVEIRVVWDPPWTVERMTEEGRAALRRLGVAA